MFDKRVLYAELVSNSLGLKTSNIESESYFCTVFNFIDEILKNLIKLNLVNRTFVLEPVMIAYISNEWSVNLTKKKMQAFILTQAGFLIVRATRVIFNAISHATTSFSNHSAVSIAKIFFF